MNIIGITGFKRSGKTTLANFFRDYHGYKVFSFADPVRDAVKDIFLISDEDFLMPKKETIDPRWGMSPRQMMQQFGTEVGRQIKSDIWVKNMQFRIENEEMVVIDDCRFPEECQLVRDLGGVVIGLQRPQAIVDSHSSEVAMFENWCTMTDITLANCSTLESLYAAGELAINYFQEGKL